MIISCVLIFGVYLFIKKRKALGIFAVRAVVGGLAIYILNQTLGIEIGINPITICTIGTLGLPGMLTLLLIS
jgi:hypothetical protein